VLLKKYFSVPLPTALFPFSKTSPEPPLETPPLTSFPVCPHPAPLKRKAFSLPSMRFSLDILSLPVIYVAPGFPTFNGMNVCPPSNLFKC